MRNCATVLFIFLCHLAFAQVTDGFTSETDSLPPYGEPDSGPKVKTNLFEGRPGKAALFSLIIPGAGQIYNRSYWKAPVVWGVVGAVGSVMAFNIDQFNDLDDRYKAAVQAEIDMEPNPDPGGLSSSQLFDLRTEANRNRQLSIVIFSFTWIGNAVEAYVDGHLKEFDISDDLSMRFKPIGPGDGPVIAQTGVAFRF